MQNPPSPPDAPAFPLFLTIAGRKVVVLGGGEMAAAKIRLLLRSAAAVLVIADHLGPDVAQLVRDGQISDWQPSPASVTGLADLLADALLVIDADDQPELTVQAQQICRENGILFNAVDRPHHSDFTVPAIFDRGPLVVAMSTGGTAPALARTVRQRLEKAIPQDFERLAIAAAACQQQVRESFSSVQARVRVWDQVFNGPLAQRIIEQDEQQAIATLRAALHELAQQQDSAPQGSVTLVGAGPGDPGLLTLHAVRAIETADVILYDALVSPEILALARREARLIPVGKRAGQPSVSQSFTNRTLASLAQRGQTVVRLKGGDPFIFGRGGEEAEYLRQQDIPVHVIPGISAAIGVAASLGIPLTHRGEARSLRLMTASCRSEIETLALDWSAFSDPGCTLAIYMGHRQAAIIRRGLLNGGLPADTPVALIENGTRPDMRAEFCPLANLGRTPIATAPSGGPVLILVGRAVAHAPGYGTSPLTEAVISQIAR